MTQQTAQKDFPSLGKMHCPGFQQLPNLTGNWPFGTWKVPERRNKEAQPDGCQAPCDVETSGQSLQVSPPRSCVPGRVCHGSVSYWGFPPYFKILSLILSRV